MKFKGKMAVKVCNFYVNNWHLLTILFSYLNKNINEKTNVITILEDDLENYAETLIEKIILNNKDKEKIIDINWRKTDVENEGFEDYFKSGITENNRVIIIVNGKVDYIESANGAIYNLIKKTGMYGKRIKIINCFDVSDENMNMGDVLNEHESVLNTSGEIKVEDFACNN